MADNLLFTSAGFYLPCFPSSFFSHSADGGYLQPSYHFAAGDLGPFNKESSVRLEANIFSRLLMVLPRKGFTTAYSIFPGNRKTASNEPHLAPTAIVFLMKDIQAAIKQIRDGTTDKQLAEKQVVHLAPLERVGVRALALVVDHDGYYVWVVAYSSGVDRTETSVQKALKEHIAAIVGGSFASHDPGRQRAASKTNAAHSSGAIDTLEKYKTEHLGILAFFQLNTVLEGMYNFNLDPRAFFRNEQGIESNYTLGGFFEHITAVFHPAKIPQQRRRPKGQQKWESDEERKRQLELEQQVQDAATLTIDRFFNLYLQEPNQLNGDDGVSAIHEFADLCLYPPACRHLLEEFLTVTEVITLKPIKGWIERCRRALIEELIEVTHRRVPLVQAEPPKGDGPVDSIDEVTEAQLRGYVMFLSAKLPLISNVLLHIQDLHYESVASRGRQRSQHPHGVGGATNIPADILSDAYGPFNSWRGLLLAIQNDLQSLTNAIDQARTDRMLYEQEQIHAEQETLAEIERLRGRSESTAASATSSTINTISNFCGFLAVVLATGPLIQNGHLTISMASFLAIINGNNIPGAEALGVGVLICIVIFVAITYTANRIFRWLVHLVRRETRREGKYYYEMDIHTDAPFLPDAIPGLIEKGAFPRPPLPLPFHSIAPQNRRRAFIAFFRGLLTMNWHGALKHAASPDFRRVVRNSYRVERQEKSEALHKIYVEADIRLSYTRYFPVVLVYELLYHRPSSDHDYILKDLRVVSTHSDELTQDEIARLKSVLVYYFINPCLEDDWRLILPSTSDGSPSSGDPSSSGSQDFDSFFTVSQTPANGIKAAAADELGSPSPGSGETVHHN